MKQVFRVSLVLIAGFFLLLPQTWAKDEDLIYRQPNNFANFVRLDNLKEKKAEEMVLNHPYRISEETMANILRSLRYSKTSLLSKKVTTRRIFEEDTIEKYTPYLVQALAQSTPFKSILWSVAQRRTSLVVFGSNRLTYIEMVVRGDQLYLRFIKTEALLPAGYEGADHKAAKLRSQARSVRVSLEPQEGQAFGDTTKEIKVDLKRDWAAIAARLDAQDREEESRAKRKGSKKTSKTPESEPSQKTPGQGQEDLPAQETSSTPSSLEQHGLERRLTELKRLKEKGLISEQEYQDKKKEILNSL
ncbi:MAG: hypothetical protein KDK66_08625 [Deltaproteobacteria bacterium]|nr:hypothetical protein [Deltaproteobacteria bacterium]